MDKQRTPYAEDQLRIAEDVDEKDIKDFLERRLRNPVTVNGVTVWNFNNHELDEDALLKATDSLRRDEYVIPYNISGVWAYMSKILPERISQAEYLGYSQSDGKYYAFPNMLFHTDAVSQTVTRGELSFTLEQCMNSN